MRRELLVLPSKHLPKCLNFAETCSGLKAMRDTEDRAKLQRRLRTMLVCLQKDLVVYYRNDRLMKLALHGNAKKAPQNQVALINDCDGVVLPFAPMTAIHHIPPGRRRRGGRHRPQRAYNSGPDVCWFCRRVIFFRRGHSPLSPPQPGGIAQACGNALRPAGAPVAGTSRGIANGVVPAAPTPRTPF